MKRIITSASLVAMGALSLQAAYDPGLSATEKAKPWSVSASLRGFYDDNYATLPKNTISATDPQLKQQGSWGFDVSPHFGLNFVMDATTASFDYTYGLKYYFDRKNSADHRHLFQAKLDHAFSENYKIDLWESFTVAQEGTVLSPSSQPIALPMRVTGNNILNDAGFNFNAQFSRIFGIEIGYQNIFNDYDNKVYSALLDRIEHSVHLDLRFKVLPKTVALAGYRFSSTEYTSKDPTAAAGQAIQPKIRDNYSHFFYAGVDQTFTPLVTGSLRAGVQVTDYHNIGNVEKNAAKAAGVNLEDSQTNPYVDAKLTYQFQSGSYIQTGVKHTRTAAYVAAMDQETTSAYLTGRYKITPKLYAGAGVSAQYGDFYANTQGSNTGADLYTADASLTYEINNYLSAEVSYEFTRLDTDTLNQSFTRNIVYFGVRAQY